MKKIILIFMSVFLVQISFAQIRQIQVVRSNESEKSKGSLLGNKAQQSDRYKEERERQRRLLDIYNAQNKEYSAETLNSADKDISDAVLYRDVVRRFTWLEGLGEPITQDIANHLPYYYRFSMKNNAGHYQLVEALHGRELTTAHPLGTYILDKDIEDDGQNNTWCEELKKVGQWVVYSDLSGEYVVEERAFEAKENDAKLIYSMQPVRNDSIHVTISYTDSRGFPADMNEREENIYGSVVYITYDSNGYDSVIDYLDGAGYRKANVDGVDQRRYIYDDHGRVIQRTSNNCVGDYTKDNWGNCGAIISFIDEYGSYSKIYVDEQLNPIRMPKGRASDEETFIRCDFHKDKWGRDLESVILTADGEKDVTSSGIHRIAYDYSSDGILMSKTYFDINGNGLTID